MPVAAVAKSQATARLAAFSVDADACNVVAVAAT